MTSAPPAINNKLAIVIGMHRSGTSVISRALRVFGVKHGNDLIIGFDNKKGHWEDRDLASMNEKLLNHIHKSWYSLTALSQQDIDTLLTSELREEARVRLNHKIIQHSAFGFKDPRTTLLLNFWHQILTDLGLAPTIILAIRRPSATIMSLKKRNQLSDLHCEYLWINYNLNAIDYLTNCKFDFAVVDYDAMLLNPYEQLNRISRSTKLKIVESELIAFSEVFLDKRLNHASPNSNAEIEAKYSLNLANEMYTTLQACSEVPHMLKSPNTKATVRSWRRSINNLHPLLRFCEEQYQQHHAAQQRLLYLEEELCSIKHSRSWRLTQPLRSVNQWLNNLL